MHSFAVTDIWNIMRVYRFLNVFCLSQGLYTYTNKVVWCTHFLVKKKTIRTVFGATLSSLFAKFLCRLHVWLHSSFPKLCSLSQCTEWVIKKHNHWMFKKKIEQNFRFLIVYLCNAFTRDVLVSIGLFTFN